MAAFSWRYRLHVHKLLFPPRNGTVNIICIGAGGSGAYCRNGTGTIGTGGGAGGLCIKEGLDVTTSGSFTITIGAGGASVYASGSTSGTAGGNTTVAGTGLSATLTANGGGGGVAFAITENGAAGEQAAQHQTVQLIVLGVLEAQWVQV